jgi:homoserine O-acetyltransferase
MHLYKFQENFKLESGREIAGLHLAYETFGTLNEDKSNAIWVVHALTANANPVEWWPGIVGEKCAIDTSKYFVICVNNPASPYGSICPLSINPDTNEPYYHDFPLFTTRDIARAFSKLRIALGLDNIRLLVGASLGGQIAMEFAIEDNMAIEKLLLLATNAKHSAWGIAFNESQRLAIEADQTWMEKRDDAGQHGLKAARSLALLSYRTPFGYNTSQTDDDDITDNFRASSYQIYQGEKLVKRFNAYSYYAITKTMDSHNVGRGRESIQKALKLIRAKTTIIGITTDLLFPITDQIFLSKNINGANLISIDSELGHDGFLTENEKIGKAIRDIL